MTYSQKYPNVNSEKKNRAQLGFKRKTQGLSSKVVFFPC